MMILVMFFHRRNHKKISSVHKQFSKNKDQLRGKIHLLWTKINDCMKINVKNIITSKTNIKLWLDIVIETPILFATLQGPTYLSPLMYSWNLRINTHKKMK